MRVVTWNVNWGFVAPHAAAETLRRLDADVICLQETTPDWQRVFETQLADIYPTQLYRHRGGAGGMAFLAKRRVDDVALVEPTAGWFPSWVVRADTPIGALHVAGVHLKPPLSDDGGVSASAYLNAGDVHLAEIRALGEAVPSDVPAIVCGDFNEGDSGDAVSWLEERGFTDALSVFDHDTDTWRWPTSVITLSGRYDHVLFSEHLDCTRAEVVEARGSDHLPVVAVLEKRGDAGR